MTKPAFECVRRIAPYSDGSGFKVEARVVKDEGPRLWIDSVFDVSQSEWADIKMAVDEMFQHAGRA
jgi:hypothetical protein